MDLRESVAEGRSAPHTKTSFGIILCRINAVTGRPEVVLVHKGYSYAFAEFVHGRYSRHNPRAIGALLDRMTSEELLDILSLNFDQMWYRIWQLAPKEELYRKKLSKFQALMRDGGGARLQDMVRQAQGLGELLWEVPKGREKSPQEGGVLCAVREMEEEAGVQKKDYRMLPNFRRVTRHVHAGVAYVSVYYVAVAGPWLASVRASGGRLDKVGAARRPIESMTEVSDVRWMDMLQIRAVDGEKKIEALVAPVFKIVKLYASGKWLRRVLNFGQESSAPRNYALVRRHSAAFAEREKCAPQAENNAEDRQICEMLNKKCQERILEGANLSLTPPSCATFRARGLKR